jgi:hypothetical protein
VSDQQPTSSWLWCNFKLQLFWVHLPPKLWLVLDQILKLCCTKKKQKHYLNTVASLQISLYMEI